MNLDIDPSGFFDMSTGVICDQRAQPFSGTDMAQEGRAVDRMNPGLHRFRRVAEHPRLDREPHAFDVGQITSLLTCTNNVGAEGFEPPTAGV